MVISCDLGGVFGFHQDFWGGTVPLNSGHTLYIIYIIIIYIIIIITYYSLYPMIIYPVSTPLSNECHVTHVCRSFLLPSPHFHP